MSADAKRTWAWVDRYSLISAFSLSRRADAIYAQDDGTFIRSAVVGVQIYRTTSVKVEKSTGRELEKMVDDEVDYCFMHRPDDFGPSDVGPDQSCNLIGYDIEGEGMTDEMWTERVKEYLKRDAGDPAKEPVSGGVREPEIPE